MWVSKLMRNKQQRKQASFIDNSEHKRGGDNFQLVSVAGGMEHDGTNHMRTGRR
jgi:hypothetical protein